MKKHKLLKNITAAIAFLFAVVFAFALPPRAQAQEISILGTQYRESKVVTWEDGGSIKWDKENTTLTLHNVSLDNITKSFVSVSTSGMKELKVVLEGKNTINGTKNIFFWQNCDLTIQGTGSLTARTTANNAVYYSSTTPSTLTIKDCTLDIQGGRQSISGYFNGPNTATLSLVVDNATLKVKGATDVKKRSGISNLKFYELKNCHIETLGVKFGERSEGNGYELLGADNDTYYGEVSIVPGVALPQREAYAVEDGTTLTFYYDANKATHTTGTVYGIHDKRKDDSGKPAWAGYNNKTNERITKVVFDSSFKDYKPSTTAYWFYYCTKLETIEGLSNLSTGLVTDMRSMFGSCASLTSLDVSNFNTAKVTDMGSMFDGCSSLTSLDVSKFDTKSVVSMAFMFRGCSKLTSLDVSSFNTEQVNEMQSMFGSCASLTSLDVSNFNTAKVTDMGSMFEGCSKLTSLNVSKFDTKSVVSMAYMFRGCSALTSLDVSSFNTEQVNSMQSMFGSCSSLTSLDVSNFNTAKVTDMGSMFGSCSKLTSLDVSKFDTKSVVSMAYMFNRCSALTSLDVSSFNTEQVNEMQSMFWSCASLTTLDVSNFNTAKVTDMGSMFEGCSKLTTIYCNDDWQSDVVINFSKMFLSCVSLKGAVAYDKSKTDVSMANPTTGYFTKKVTAFTDKIGTGGYSTFAVGDKSGTISGNVELYTGTVSGDKLILVPRTDKSLPAGACVLLKGAEGETFTFTPDGTVTPAAMPADNALTGGASAYTVVSTDDIFALATIGTTTAFYRVENGVEIPAHRAYIRLTTAKAKALKVIEIGGKPTGIPTIGTATEGDNTIIYNLAGQRVEKMEHGIYIVNGKKVFKK